MHGYLSLEIICSSKLTVFLELRSRKTVRFSEQIMSADKYPSIFSRQMETIVYIFWCQMEAIVYVKQRSLLFNALNNKNNVSRQISSLFLQDKSSKPLLHSAPSLGVSCISFFLDDPCWWLKFIGTIFLSRGRICIYIIDYFYLFLLQATKSPTSLTF